MGALSKLSKHQIYWQIPAAFVLICMLLYFLNPMGLSAVVAPEFNRELGLIENVQLLVIILLFLVGYRHFKASDVRWERLMALGVMAFAAFIFLEEVDYGLHIFDYVTGRSELEVLSDSQGEVRNIHNQYDLAHWFKMATYILFIILILVLPFVVKKMRLNNTWISRFTPSHYLIYTLVAMTVLNQLALFMDDYVKDSSITSLDHNVSEFEEFFLYYIMFLYASEVLGKEPHTVADPSVN